MQTSKEMTKILRLRWGQRYAYFLRQNHLCKKHKYYSSISNMAKETKEPIYITKNGEGDLVLMSIEVFEKREQMLQLRAKILQAEQERIDGEETLSTEQARKRLRERVNGI